ncbi:MAG: protein kinase [Mycolicibacterium insubricum]|nr:protein kinase [Mycobacterium sp.]
MEGTPFGRYRLIELLGRGGMGEVWRAYDTDTDRVVALKLLPAHLATDPSFEQRFRREAHAAARLHNAHVVPIHNYGEIGGRLYVDMALIDGHDLTSEINSGALDPERAVAIVEQIARALTAAHKAGLVHRDIKPSNILIDDDDIAYLIDFGIVRASTDAALTGTGNTLGTFNYMAPERFTADEVDHRSDVYALACVFYEALTGTRTFPGDTLERQVVGHLHTPPPQPSTSGLSPAFDDVIATGLAKDPAQRYQNAKDLAVAARAALTAPAVTPPAAPARPVEQAPPVEAATAFIAKPVTPAFSTPDVAPVSAGPDSDAPPISSWQGPPTTHIARPIAPKAPERVPTTPSTGAKHHVAERVSTPPAHPSLRREHPAFFALLVGFILFVTVGSRYVLIYWATHEDPSPDGRNAATQSTSPPVSPHVDPDAWNKGGDTTCSDFLSADYGTQWQMITKMMTEQGWTWAVDTELANVTNYCQTSWVSPDALIRTGP